MAEITTEPKTPKKPPQAAQAAKKKSSLKKLDQETAKVFASLKDKANKKAFGRKVKDTEIIALGLSLIEPHHILHLQNQTLSEKDRLHMAHDEYQKTNGKLTMDQFIGKLIRGEIHLRESK